MKSLCHISSLTITLVLTWYEYQLTWTPVTDTSRKFIYHNVNCNTLFLHFKIFIRRSWYSVLPSLDAVISCHMKKAVVGVDSISHCLVTYIVGLEVLVALCLLDVRNNLLSNHQTLDCLRYLSHLQQVSSYQTMQYFTNCVLCNFVFNKLMIYWDLLQSLSHS